LRMRRRILTALLILAALFLWRCSSPNIDTGGSIHLPALRSYTFYIAKDVSNETGLAIDEAVKQWTTFTDVTIKVQSADQSEGALLCFVTPGCFTIYEIPQSELDTLTLDSSYIGYTFLGLMGIAQDMTWDQRQDTMIHEFGHALGLEHHALPAMAVMNPDYGYFDHIYCDDVAQYYAVRPQLEAGVGADASCSDVPGAFDEAPDGGPALTP
jgi:hypothetical protein